GAFLVLEAQLVEAVRIAARRAARPDGALRLVVRQDVWRHQVGVVNATGDERPVRVAFEEINDDFLADPRVEDHAPAAAGPVLGDAHPTGAVLVFLAQAVPGELPLPPAVLVQEDLLLGRADDDGRLGPLDEGLGRAPLRAVFPRGRHAGERVPILGAVAA